MTSLDSQRSARSRSRRNGARTLDEFPDGPAARVFARVLDEAGELSHPVTPHSLGFSIGVIDPTTHRSVDSGLCLRTGEFRVCTAFLVTSGLTSDDEAARWRSALRGLAGMYRVGPHALGLKIRPGTESEAYECALAVMLHVENLARLAEPPASIE